MTQDSGPSNARSGLTLIEVAIAAAVIAVLIVIAALVYVRRERERFQAIADSEPGKVFRVECVADKPQFGQGETVTLNARLFNTTNHRLEFKIWNDAECWLALSLGNEPAEFIAMGTITECDGRRIFDIDTEPLSPNEVEVLRMASVSIEGSEIGQVGLTIETSYVPAGTWSAELWIDTCGEHSGVLPSDPTQDHLVKSPPFRLTVAPISGSEP